MVAKYNKNGTPKKVTKVESGAELLGETYWFLNPLTDSYERVLVVSEVPRIKIVLEYVSNEAHAARTTIKSEDKLVTTREKLFVAC